MRQFTVCPADDQVQMVSHDDISINLQAFLLLAEFQTVNYLVGVQRSAENIQPTTVKVRKNKPSPCVFLSSDMGLFSKYKNQACLRTYLTARRATG